MLWKMSVEVKSKITGALGIIPKSLKRNSQVLKKTVAQDSCRGT